MVNIKINGQAYSVAENTTILEAAAQAGIKIPTLCYMKDINKIGACRVCLVELEGREQLFAACDNVCSEGMSIITNSARVMDARRTNVELILSQHRVDCPSCARNDSCHLREIASELGIRNLENFQSDYRESDWNRNLPIIRDESKCIRCYRCVSECEKVQTVSVWDMVGSGSHTTVGTVGSVPLEESNCVFCGQCVTHCPTGALSVRFDIDQVMGYKGVLTDPNKVTVVQVAPAVRSAWGEELGLPSNVATEKRLAAALRKIGFDYVFDTNFSADLTIMEEGTEFLHRLQHRDDYQWPMFTSCCPGWVRFLKNQYPDMVPQLSTAKSPQQMFGAITKSYFAQKIGVDPANLVCVSVMPCAAKKAELAIPNINDANEGLLDVDISITTRELCNILKIFQVDVASLEEEEFDSPLGCGTGAAVIFGTTGGVMEAALRTCYYVMTGTNPDADSSFKDVRSSGTNMPGMDTNGYNPWTEVNYNVNGTIIRTAVAHSLGNARKLIEALRHGDVEYDFVEIMACPGGCVGGGGQPIHYNEEKAPERSHVLYSIDKANPLRFSHENPDVQALYREFLKEPCGELSHHLLHTDHMGW